MPNNRIAMSVWPPVTKRRTEWSYILTPLHVRWLLDVGFLWVRPVRRSWAATLREPTVGRYIEFTSQWELGSVLVQSPEGRRLIRQTAVRS